MEDEVDEVALNVLAEDVGFPTALAASTGQPQRLPSWLVVIAGLISVAVALALRIAL
jgi:hypothetical protein